MNSMIFLQKLAFACCINLMWFCMGIAQTTEINRQVAGAAGNGISITTGDWTGRTIEFTVGEAFITTATGSSVILTQGFHQPETDLVSSTREAPASDEPGILLFPNPTDQLLNVSFLSPRGHRYRMHIVNAKGQALGPEQIIDDHNPAQIDLSRLPSGIYWLRLHAASLSRPALYPFVKK